MRTSILYLNIKSIFTFNNLFYKKCCQNFPWYFLSQFDSVTQYTLFYGNTLDVTQLHIQPKKWTSKNNGRRGEEGLKKIEKGGVHNVGRGLHRMVGLGTFCQLVVVLIDKMSHFFITQISYPSGVSFVVLCVVSA